LSPIPGCVRLLQQLTIFSPCHLLVAAEDGQCDLIYEKMTALNFLSWCDAMLVRYKLLLCVCHNHAGICIKMAKCSIMQTTPRYTPGTLMPEIFTKF